MAVGRKSKHPQALSLNRKHVVSNRLTYPQHTDAGLSLVSLAMLAGSIIMLFFIILSGVTGTPPLNKTWFLQADTSGITGAHHISQWTYFYVCGLGNKNCGKASPAMPFGHAWANHPTGAPPQLVG